VPPREEVAVLSVRSVFSLTYARARVSPVPARESVPSSMMLLSPSIRLTSRSVYAGSPKRTTLYLGAHVDRDAFDMSGSACDRISTMLAASQSAEKSSDIVTAA